MKKSQKQAIHIECGGSKVDCCSRIRVAMQMKEKVDKKKWQHRGLNTGPPELQSVALPAELSRLVTTDQHALVAVNTYLSRIQEGKMRSTPILFKP